MDPVLLTKLYLEYPQATTVKVTKTIQLAESMYGYGTNEYYKYIDKYTEPSEKKLVAAINEQVIAESGREYMGVTIYSNNNGTYSVPELGIYNIEDAKNVKIAVKSKLSQTFTQKNIKEDADYVIDNIFEIADITDIQFLNFVLNEMTESDYIELGGKNFKNFVLLISETVEQEWEMPTSLINESYIFDEGIGDFVKKVKSGISDAHLNLAYAAPGVASTLGDAYTRHNNAVTDAKKKLGNLGTTTVDKATAARDKIKGAVGRTLSKDNLRMGARIAGAVAVAAGKGLYNTADAVATGIGNTAATGAAVASLTDKASRKNKSSEPRSKSDVANGILDKLRVDGNAEKATNTIPTQRMTSKQKGVEYDKYIKSLKEDVELQLDFIKYWLQENEIFETLEEIDDYILNEMDKEEYSFILSEITHPIDMKKYIDTQKPRTVAGDGSKIGSYKKRIRGDMDFASAKYKEAYIKKIEAAHEPASKAKLYDPNGSMLKRPSVTSMNALSKAHESGYSVYTSHKKPDSHITPLGKPLSTPAHRKPLGSPLPTPAHRKPLGKPIDNPHNIAYKNAIASLHEPAAKTTSYNPNGSMLKRSNSKQPMSSLTLDNLTTVGKSRNTIILPKDKFTDKLRNAFTNKKVQPSSLISVVSNKAKKLAGHVVGGIKKRLFGESLQESDIKNWIEEAEFYQVAEWLIENDVFEDDDELVDYLYEGLNWEDLELINYDIEQRALELIIESLCDEDTYDSTYVVLESLLGDEFVELLDEMVNDSDSYDYEPMPIKTVDCSCGKSGCKSCSKKSWKSKVYNKMVEDK